MCLFCPFKDETPEINTVAYNVVLSEETLTKIDQYRQEIITNPDQMGSYLEQKIRNCNKSMSDISNTEFIELILATKKPTIFAESIEADGIDWNNKELEILGDINITMPVTIYDNGVWPTETGYPDHFKQHKAPFEGELLFSPGALLGLCSHGKFPDLVEVTDENEAIDQQRYNKLITRRLLPILAYVNEQADIDGKKAVVTMPGMGAGNFAGRYRGTIGNHLNVAMKAMLEKYSSNLQNIVLIHYDPFGECHKEQHQFNNIKYRVRPALKGNKNKFKTQLSNPSDLEDQKGEFENTKLYKIVAWNHVSWPGNGFISGVKNTDDGIAAGGTDAMKILMGEAGHYDQQRGEYLPPKGYRTWKDYAITNGVRLHASDNIKIVDDKGKIYQLEEKIDLLV